MHPLPGLASVVDIARIGLSLGKRKAIGRCRPARQRVEDLAAQVVKLLEPLDLGDRILVLGAASQVVERPLAAQVEEALSHAREQPVRREVPCRSEKLLEPVRRRGCTGPVAGVRHALERLLALELPAGPLSIVYEGLRELERIAAESPLSAKIERDAKKLAKRYSGTSRGNAVAILKRAASITEQGPRVGGHRGPSRFPFTQARVHG